MPTFATPEPITVSIWVPAGDIRITATERTDTVVDVQPGDVGRDEDVRAAEQTRVDFTDGHLSVRAPKPRNWGLFGRTASVDIGIVLEGETWLVLDDGSETRMTASDVVIQRATNHAWENRSDAVVRMAFVMIDGALSEAVQASTGPLTYFDAVLDA